MTKKIASPDASQFAALLRRCLELYPDRLTYEGDPASAGPSALRFFTANAQKMGAGFMAELRQAVSRQDPEMFLVLMLVAAMKVFEELVRLKIDRAGAYTVIAKTSVNLLINNIDIFDNHMHRFEEDPTLGNYVALRRANPEMDCGLDTIEAMGLLHHLNDELVKYGFDPRLVAYVMDADEEAICELSLQISERLLETKALEAKGETQVRGRLVPPDRLLRFLVVAMLEAIEWNGSYRAPLDLIMLLRELVGGPSAEYAAIAESARNRRLALERACHLRAEGVRPTMTAIAAKLGVDKSQVSRWFQGENLEALVDEQFPTWSFQRERMLQPMEYEQLRCAQ